MPGHRTGCPERLRLRPTLCVAVQISGGNKYLPPRQDVNAPDLYIPLCALFTYVVMASHGGCGPQALLASLAVQPGERLHPSSPAWRDPDSTSVSLAASRRAWLSSSMQWLSEPPADSRQPGCGGWTADALSRRRPAAPGAPGCCTRCCSRPCCTCWAWRRPCPGWSWPAMRATPLLPSASP